MQLPSWIDFLHHVRRQLEPHWEAPLRLLAIDPGETTGVVLLLDGKLHYSTDLKMTCGSKGNKNSAGSKNLNPQEVETLFDAMKPTHIVMEDYIVYQHKAENHAHNELFTAKLIGMIVMVAHQRNIPIYWQLAATAKPFATDKKLKQWGLYTKLAHHSRDAMRHAIYFLLFNKDIA